MCFIYNFVQSSKIKELCTLLNLFNKRIGVVECSLILYLLKLFVLVASKHNTANQVIENVAHIIAQIFMSNDVRYLQLVSTISY